jgi:hypothetical protein
MQQHVKILAVLHIVLSSLGILAGLIAMAVFGGLASLANWSESSQNGIGAVSGEFVGLLGAAVMLVIFCVSVPGLIAGIGLLSYQRWARILTIIISLWICSRRHCTRRWGFMDYMCCCRMKARSYLGGPHRSWVDKTILHLWPRGGITKMKNTPRPLSAEALGSFRLGGGTEPGGLYVRTSALFLSCSG